MENSVYQQLWGCCRCPFGSAGSFGLPSFIDFCTECQHRRCPDCPRERQKTLFHDVRLCPQSFQLNNSTESYPGTATNGIFTVPSTTQFIPQSHVGSLRDYQQEAQEAEDMRERQRPRRKRSHKHASASKTTSGNTFACHFCKRSPQQYNPWAGDDRYLKCLYPKPDGLRRIKDHFNQMHLLPYFRCIRCYTMFEDENDLHSHEYSTTCISAPSPPLDGIDIGQMRRIDVVLKARTDKWKTDAEKWLDIWAILFPGTRPPKSPYSEPPLWSPAAILSEVEYTIELKYELHLLKRSEESHRIWMDIFKEALDTVLESYEEIKDDPQSIEDIADIGDMKQFDLNDFRQRGECKAESALKEDEQDPTQDSPKPDAHALWEFEDFVHSSPSMDFQGNDFLNPDEQSFPPVYLPPPSVTESSPKEEAKTKALSASNYDASFYTQNTVAINSSSCEPPKGLNIDNTELTFDDLLTSIQCPEFESRESVAEIMDFPSLFEAEDYDSIPRFGDDFENGIEPYIDTLDMEGLLAYESRQPNANGPISHIRDMNKGLKGRYEYDGSM